MEVIPLLTGLVLLVILIVPGGYYLLPVASAFFLNLALITILVFVGFVVYHLFARSRARGLSCAAEMPQSDTKSEVPRSQSTTLELLERLRAIDWYQFEKIVALVYKKSGFEVERGGGAKPDGGIDILLTGPDGERTAIQCKHWKTWNVGVKAIREFIGALKDARVSNGVVVTLAGYTGEAKQLAGRNGIELLNETGFVTLLESTDARFDPEVLELLNDMRKFCPKCESELILRTAGKGFRSGNQFWGCSAFPRCRFTMPRS